MKRWRNSRAIGLRDTRSWLYLSEIVRGGWCLIELENQYKKAMNAGL